MQHVKCDDGPPAYYENEADLIAIINHHWREEDKRWRASDRQERIMVREVTISRFLIGAILLVSLIDKILT